MLRQRIRMGPFPWAYMDLIEQTTRILVCPIDRFNIGIRFVSIHADSLLFLWYILFVFISLCACLCFGFNQVSHPSPSPFANSPQNVQIWYVCITQECLLYRANAIDYTIQHRFKGTQQSERQSDIFLYVLCTCAYSAYRAKTYFQYIVYVYSMHKEFLYSSSHWWIDRRSCKQNFRINRTGDENPLSLFIVQ